MINVLVMASIISMLALVTLQSVSKPMTVTQDENTKLTIFTLRQNLTTYLSNGDAWAQTLADAANPGLACVTAEDCTGEVGNRFDINRIYDPTGNVVYDRTAGLNGFDYAGQPCNVTTGSCPFVLNLTWTPSCVTCTGPGLLANIQGEFRDFRSEGRNEIINLSRYDIEITR